MSDVSDECVERRQITQGQRAELIVSVTNKKTGLPLVDELAAATEIQSAHPQLTDGDFLVKELERSAIAEVTDILCIADVAGLLGGTYFLYKSILTQYVFWFDVDNGSSAPTVAGATLVEVDISEDDTAGTVASALQAAMDGESDITATVDTATVTANNDTGGKVVDAADPVTPSQQTNFTFTVATQGKDAVTDSVEVIAGTAQIKIKLQQDETLLLKPETRATVHLAIDFALPLGRQIYKIKDFYDVCAAEFTLDQNV